MSIKISDLIKKRKPNLNSSLNTSSNNSYSCLLCSGPFENSSELTKHLISDHKIISTTCTPCNITYSNIQSYVIHSHFKHKATMIKNALTKNIVQVHQVSVQNDEEERVQSDKQAEKGQFQDDEQNVKTDLTNNTSKSEEIVLKRSQRIRKKSRIITNSEGYCEICCENFGTDDNLSLHEDAVHHKTSKICTICKNNFASLKHLQNHMKSAHQNGSTQKCPLCPEETFVKNGFLVHHFILVHDIQGNKCKYCNMEFQSIFEHSRHLFMNHNKTEVKNNLKSKGVKTKIKPNVNMTPKNNIRRQSAPVQLPADFEAKNPQKSQGVEPNESQNLASRIYIRRKSAVRASLKLKENQSQGSIQEAPQSGDRNQSKSSKKPLSCPKCDVKFASNMILRTHLLKGTENLHFCKACKFKACILQDLNYHTVVNHMKDINVEPANKKIQIVCTICKKSFTSMAFFKLHLRKGCTGSSLTISQITPNRPSNPAIKQGSPLVKGLNSTITESNPVITGLNPTTTKSNPAIKPRSPVVKGLNSKITESNPVIAGLNPISKKSNPVIKGLNPALIITKETKSPLPVKSLDWGCPKCLKRFEAKAEFFTHLKTCSKPLVTKNKTGNSRCPKCCGMYPKGQLFQHVKSCRFQKCLACKNTFPSMANFNRHMKITADESICTIVGEKYGSLEISKKRHCNRCNHDYSSVQEYQAHLINGHCRLPSTVTLNIQPQNGQISTNSAPISTKKHQCIDCKRDYDLKTLESHRFINCTKSGCNFKSCLVQNLLEHTKKAHQTKAEPAQKRKSTSTTSKPVKKIPKIMLVPFKRK